MNDLMQPRRTESANDLRLRIFNVLEAGTYQMDRLLRLFDICESRECETACVEVTGCPRLLVNPDFVAEHCQTDEHLLMLVLHELNHVLLGHTRLFGRATPLHNIAFDAVINSQLCWQFPKSQFSGFFRSLNSATEFPARLLRPPVGWPDHIVLPSDAGPREREVLTALYGKDSDPVHVTYHEIFELLLKLLRNRDKRKGSRKGRGSRPQSGTPVLLGDHSDRHGDSMADKQAAADAALRRGLREVVENWPRPPRLIHGRDLGRNSEDERLRAGMTRMAFRRACERLFRKAGVLRPEASKRLHRGEGEYEVLSPLPDLRDRRAHAWTELTGLETLLFRSATNAPRPRRTMRPAHVYLDISGSMMGVLPDIVASLERAHRDGSCRLFAFSTIVSEVVGRTLADATARSTGGTDIKCVFAHVLEQPERKRPKAVVVLTDGYTGSPHVSQAQEFIRTGIQIFVGLAGSSVSDELKGFAKCCEKLPWEETR